MKNYLLTILIILIISTLIVFIQACGPSEEELRSEKYQLQQSVKSLRTEKTKLTEAVDSLFVEESVLEHLAISERAIYLLNVKIETNVEISVSYYSKKSEMTESKDVDEDSEMTFWIPVDESLYKRVKRGTKLFKESWFGTTKENIIDIDYDDFEEVMMEVLDKRIEYVLIN